MLEVFTDVFHRGSFIPILVPTPLDEFPCASTKPDIIRIFRFARPFALHYEQGNFYHPTSLVAEGGASYEHLVYRYSEGIDVCLLGNFVEFLREE